MTDSKTYWNSTHQKYADSDWINKPTIFAQDAIKFFPKQGKILELGAGQGQDSRYFAEKGYEVISTDFSSKALEINKQKTSSKIQPLIRHQTLDLSQIFPFPDNSFEIVYSHLAIHYFDDTTTNQIFSEIYRVLKPNGVVALLTNSINDHEINTGIKLAEHYYEVYGTKKRYFSIEEMTQRTERFKKVLLDDKGDTYKDRKLGVTNLIRYIGKKDE